MTTSSLTTFRIALYGVLIENDHVLLTNTRVPSGIITNFPGGGLHLGEAPLEALKREFKEEVAMSISIEELLFCSQVFQQNPEYPNEQLMHIYYRVKRVSGDIRHDGNNEDVASIVWCAPEELSSQRILGVDREFIDHWSFRSIFKIS